MITAMSYEIVAAGSEVSVLDIALASQLKTRWTKVENDTSVTCTRYGKSKEIVKHLRAVGYYGRDDPLGENFTPENIDGAAQKKTRECPKEKNSKECAREAKDAAESLKTNCDWTETPIRRFRRI